ncbi:MAG: hypothetical protein AAGF12_23660 [Myxococcota bacterium]
MLVFRTEARVIAFAVVLLSGCASDPTQVVIRLDVDPPSASRVTFFRVSVTNQEGTTVADGVVAPAGEIPAEIPLIPRGNDSTRRFVFESEFFDSVDAPAVNSMPFARIRAQAGYVDAEVRDLPLELTGACHDRSCSEGQVCSRGFCFGACFDSVPRPATARDTAPRCTECQECAANQCRNLAEDVSCGCPGNGCTGGVCRGLRTTALAAGFASTCASKGGRLYCWGSNDQQELGVPGAVEPVLSPIEVRTTPVNALALGGSDNNGAQPYDAHACFLSLGRLFCWGGNRTGQLGLGDNIGRDEPAELTAPMEMWDELDAGGFHTCASTRLGSLYCWGVGDDGQLGQGDRDGSTTPRSVDLPNVSALCTGYAHTCAVSDGDVFCFGFNVNGELGRATETTCDRGGGQVIPCSLTPIAANTEGRRFASLACGDFHTCGLTEDGEVWCWGGNGNGNLGRGDIEGANFRPEPVNGGFRFTQLSSGRSHNCAVRDDGAILCWGRNDEGELGLGDTLTRTEPTIVPSSLEWRDVALGERHSCAIDSGDRIFCWGMNSEGQLGQGDIENRSSPAEVCVPDGG